MLKYHRVHRRLALKAHLGERQQTEPSRKGSSRPDLTFVRVLHKIYVNKIILGGIHKTI